MCLAFAIKKEEQILLGVEDGVFFFLFAGFFLGVLCLFAVQADLKGCEGGHDCLGSEGVLRISLGCFVSIPLLCVFSY